MNLVAASPLLATSTEWMARSPPHSAQQASSAAATSAVRLGTPRRVEELQGVREGKTTGGQIIRGDETLAGRFGPAPTTAAVAQPNHQVK